MNVQFGPSSQLERELNYYRRECNDLGARLLRQQEELSQAFREARRSRTVVKLVREAYRLGDLRTMDVDVGGPMLELVVDNTLCDKAALLRESSVGSGRFVVAHAIGLTGSVIDTIVTLPDAPAFLYTSGQSPIPPGCTPLTTLLQVPYLLWSYDRMSGHALLIGNRSESNVNRPFEAGDQELIESALSVYLDVLYRKQVESELRGAKQAAEAASRRRLDLLAMITQELRPALQTLIALAADEVADEVVGRTAPGGETRAARIGEMSAYLLSLLDDASTDGSADANAPAPDLEWVYIEEITRAVLRHAYVPSVRRGIEIDAALPRRRTAVCVDRQRMQTVLRHLLAGAFRLTADCGTVRLHSGRRSDGSVEIVVRAGRQTVDLAAEPDAAGPDFDPVRRFGDGLTITRQLTETQGCALLFETTNDGLLQTRVIVPARNVRVEDIAVDALR